MPADPKSLEQAIADVRSLPEKYSRSYLSDAEGVICELRAKGYTFRDIRAYLTTHLNLCPSLSTLYIFHKKASKRRILKEKASRRQPAPKATSTTQTESPQNQKSLSIEGGNAAIRALKAKVQTAGASEEHPRFDFDPSKPLISEPEL